MIILDTLIIGTYSFRKGTSLVVDENPSRSIWNSSLLLPVIINSDTDDDDVMLLLDEDVDSFTTTLFDILY